MPGVAGKKALVKVPGVAVTLTNEACGDTGDHQTYQITNAAKRVIDRATTLVVKVGGSVTGESYTFNRLTGKITFATVNAGRGAVTVSGAYLPLNVAVGASDFRFTLAQPALEDTDFDGANTTGGFSTCQSGIKTLSGSIGRRLQVADTVLRDALITGDPIVIEFFVDRSGAHDMICWALLTQDSVEQALNDIQGATIEFKGTADDQGVMVA